MRCTAVVVLVSLFGYVAAATFGNQTELLVGQDGLLSRRVRALLFPKKASVLITAAMTKIIVGGRPGGLQYSLEFDMYVALPDTVEGWRPNILLDHAKHKNPTAPKPKRRWDWPFQDYRRNGTRYSYPLGNPNLYYRVPYQPEYYAK